MKTLKSFSKISMIALITFIFVTFANNTFAQNKTGNKQNIAKQDTIVLKSLPWKEEYGVDEATWKTLELKDQKDLITISADDITKVVREETERLSKENEEMLKQLSGTKNDTIQKKK
jgi:hypothetical protein